MLQKRLARNILERYAGHGNATVTMSKALSGPFLYHGLINLLFGGLRASPGYVLRRIFYRRLFQSAGSGLILGHGLVVRRPDRISLGNRVAMDDNVKLDASGSRASGITIGDDVIISRNSLIQAKSGSIVISRRGEIGVNTIISAMNDIHIGACALIGPDCCVGQGRDAPEQSDMPRKSLDQAPKQPLVLGDDVWLGKGVAVLDGVRIGNGCVVGARAVVSEDLPDYAVAVGIPARIVRFRNSSGGASESAP